MRQRAIRDGSGVTALALGLVIAVGCGGGAKQQPLKTPELNTGEKARMAQSLLNAGQQAEALKTIEEAVATEPDNPALRRFHGAMLFRLGRYEQAAATLERALELDEYLTDARRVLGAVYNELGRAADAEREWKTALDDPAYAEPEKVYLNLGILYGQQGRDEDAVDMLRQAVRIDPRYWQAHFELASTLDRLGQLDEAVREYQVASPGFSNDGEFHYRVGFAYFRLGEKAKARESLNRTIAVAPGSPSAARADDLLKVID